MHLLRSQHWESFAVHQVNWVEPKMCITWGIKKVHSLASMCWTWQLRWLNSNLLQQSPQQRPLQQPRLLYKKLPPFWPRLAWPFLIGTYFIHHFGQLVDIANGKRETAWRPCGKYWTLNKVRSLPYFPNLKTFLPLSSLWWVCLVFSTVNLVRDCHKTDTSPCC